MDLYVPETQVNDVIWCISNLNPHYFKTSGFSMGEHLTDNITHRVHLLNMEDQFCNITIHVSSTNSVIRPLFSLQNTLEMTFISGYGIACAYPRLTMHCKGLWNIAGEEDTPSEPGYVMMLRESAAVL